MTTTKLTLPTVHLNGSGQSSLLRQYNETYLAVYAAVVSLRKLDIHDRDYYPQGPDAGPKARAENQARIDKLLGVLEEIEAIYKSVEP